MMYNIQTDPTPNMKSVLAVSNTDSKRSKALSPQKIHTVPRRHSLKSELPKLSVKSDVYNKISNYMNYPNNRVRQEIIMLANHGYDYFQMMQQASTSNIKTNITK